MNNALMNDLVQSTFIAMDEMPDCSDIYISGILLNDSETNKHIEILAHVQAIIIQSLQTNNQKRALRYIAALKILYRNNNISQTKLRESITEKLITQL